MISFKQLQGLMGLILIIGMLLSMSLVVIGGAMYLWQFGADNMNVMLNANTHYNVSIQQIFIDAFTSPLAMIELGLMILVITQVLRVALLAIYYAAIRDMKFILISFFILSVLVYSIFLRN